MNERLDPKTINGINYVTWGMIIEHHGKEWAEKWSTAAGEGNTMMLVEEDGEKVGGIYMDDYERFADVVDAAIPTYWD
tara:strand:- start:727 stop:960 length:234 start_codon:yes stop_codon:yes gene_type:complete